MGVTYLTSSRMLSVPALNACRTKVQRWWVLGSGTKGEGDELVWAIPTTTITKRCGFCQAFFYFTISGDYKPEFTPLVDTELLHILQLHLTSAGPVTRLGRWDQVQGTVCDACAPLVSIANIVLGDTTKGIPEGGPAHQPRSVCVRVSWTAL